MTGYEETEKAEAFYRQGCRALLEGQPAEVSEACFRQCLAAAENRSRYHYQREIVHTLYRQIRSTQERAADQLGGKERECQEWEYLHLRQAGWRQRWETGRAARRARRELLKLQQYYEGELDALRGSAERFALKENANMGTHQNTP